MRNDKIDGLETRKPDDKTKNPDNPNLPGACYIADPQTGEQNCHLLTPAACAARGGVFVGGPCGPGAQTM